MRWLFGNSVGVFVGLTVILFGAAAFMTGNALAATWRPAWHIVPYMFLLGLATRFMSFALFEGRLLHLPGYLVDVAVLMAMAFLAYRMTRVRKMVSQYPWLYERVGLFAWRDRRGAE